MVKNTNGESRIMWITESVKNTSPYSLISERNKNLRIIRDYLDLFCNRSVDFDEVKLVMSKNGLKDYFLVLRLDDFSFNTLSVVRYDGLDMTDRVFDTQDSSTEEICRVFLSRVKSHLINDWHLSEIRVFSSLGVEFHHDFSADGRQGCIKKEKTKWIN